MRTLIVGLQGSRGLPARTLPCPAQPALKKVPLQVFSVRGLRCSWPLSSCP